MDAQQDIGGAQALLSMTKKDEPDVDHLGDTVEAAVIKYVGGTLSHRPTVPRKRAEEELAWLLEGDDYLAEFEELEEGHKRRRVATRSPKKDPRGSRTRPKHDIDPNLMELQPEYLAEDSLMEEIEELTGSAEEEEEDKHYRTYKDSDSDTSHTPSAPSNASPTEFSPSPSDHEKLVEEALLDVRELTKHIRESAIHQLAHAASALDSTGGRDDHADTENGHTGTGASHNGTGTTHSGTGTHQGATGTHHATYTRSRGHTATHAGTHTSDSHPDTSSTHTSAHTSSAHTIPTSTPPSRTSTSTRSSALSSALSAVRASLAKPPRRTPSPGSDTDPAPAPEVSRHQRHNPREYCAAELERTYAHMPSVDQVVEEASARAVAWYNQTDDGRRHPCVPGERQRAGPRMFARAEIDAVDYFIAGYCYLHQLSRADVCARIWSRQRKKDGFWEALVRVLPYRSRASVYKHVRRQYHVFPVRARWSEAEDARLRSLATTMESQWKEIGQLMGRMPEDCRDRWRNYVKCDNRSQHKWSAEEEARLLAAVAAVAADSRADTINWTKVGEKMETRSRIQCRYKWNKMVKTQRALRVRVMATGTREWLAGQVARQAPEQWADVDWAALASAFNARAREQGQKPDDWDGHEFSAAVDHWASVAVKEWRSMPVAAAAHQWWQWERGYREGPVVEEARPQLYSLWREMEVEN
ncbi:hypothetical protein DICA2_C16248 [Diutina catenulata]